MKSSRVWARVAAGAFVVVSVGFLGRSLVVTWRDTDGKMLPGSGRLALAALIMVVGILSSTIAWVVLLGHARRRAHSSGFLVAQLGKYVPGGIWQAMGQVGFARSAGVTLARATTAFAALAVAQVAAGAVCASALGLVWTSAPVLLRIAIGLAVGAVVLLDRRWMVWAVRRVPRASAAHADEVPGQRSILGAAFGCVASVMALSIAYAVLLGGVTNVDDLALVVFAQAAAWTVGFLAVPIPSGLGVREIVLVAVLGSSMPAHVIVAASVFLRLVVIVVEAALAGVALLVRRWDPAAANAVIAEDEQ